MRFFVPVLVGLLSVASCKSKTEAAPAESAGAAPSAAATPSAAASAGVLLKVVPAPADVAAPPADAQKTESGLTTKVLTPGTGTEHPGLEDKVKVHYTGWTTGGEMFDSSVARGEPITFAVRHVIKGWTEALQLMVVGEKRRLWIPAALAYGDHPMGGAPGGNLTFDVELLDIKKAPAPPPVPEDVKEAPKTAKKTKSGLAYRILKPVPTGKQPKGTDTVLVHYSGWTTDGKLFDSSVMRGQPISFRLDQVIKGWTEGLQLMKVGEKARFWIPGDLAYGDKPTRPGAPSGMLVFDVELLDIPSQAGAAPSAAPSHS